MIKRILFIISILTLVPQYHCLSKTVNKEEFANQFGFMNPSCKRDLQNSLLMYKSIEKHYQNHDDPFYVVVPKKDKSLFFSSYNANLKIGSIKKIPTFLTDEEIFAKCNIKDMDGLPKEQGWFRQQVIKLCFSKLQLLRHYIGIDSDVRATRDFNRDIFYDKKTGILKIMYNPNRREAFVTDTVVKELGIKNQKHNKFFVTEPGIYDSDVLRELLAYTSKIDPKRKSDFYQLIKISPWEMQWQGQFLSYFHPDKFIPMNIINAVIHSSPYSQDRLDLSCKILAYNENCIDFNDKIFKHVQSAIFAQGEYVDSIDDFRKIYCQNIQQVDKYNFWHSFYNLQCKFMTCKVHNRSASDAYYDNLESLDKYTSQEARTFDMWKIMFIFWGIYYYFMIFRKKENNTQIQV